MTSLGSGANFAGAEEGEDESYIEPHDGQLLPPAIFRPFFTLIEEAETGEHHHPSVHYVFSDDDPDIITSAVVESLYAEQRTEKRDVPMQERFVLLDVASDGRTIASAQSLGSSWQISNTVVSQAPSWTDAGPDQALGGLMLRVKGTEGYRKSKDQDEKKSQQDVVAGMEAVIGVYEDRLAQLEKFVKRDLPEEEEGNQGGETKDQETA